MNLNLWQCDLEETLERVEVMGGCDLVCMSPPYCDARTYGNDVNWKLPDYQRLGDCVKRALKPGGHCLMVLDAPVREWRKGYGTERGFMPWVVMLDWAERVGLRVPDRLAYGRQGQVGAFPGRFRNDWEPLLWFQRVGAVGWMDTRAVAERIQAYRVGGTMREKDGTRSLKRPKQCDVRYRGTLWQYGATGNGHDDAVLQATDHSARFSLRLASDIVRCFCPPGGLVCDPFLGSGTTLMACYDHGRDFAGGDLFCRPSDGVPWIDVARGVLERRTAQQRMF